MTSLQCTNAAVYCQYTVYSLLYNSSDYKLAHKIISIMNLNVRYLQAINTSKTTQKEANTEVTTTKRH